MLKKKKGRQRTWWGRTIGSCSISHQLGYVNCFDVWVPHKLSEKNLLDCISACNSLLKLHKNVPFLKQIVTGDEKWILYHNVERKR